MQARLDHVLQPSPTPTDVSAAQAARSRHTHTQGRHLSILSEVPFAFTFFFELMYLRNYVDLDLASGKYSFPELTT
jgi:hypothetical protein